MANHRPNPDDKQGSSLAQAAKTYLQVEKIAQIALILPCAVLIGWLGGSWLDGRFHQSWMTITGFLIGCVAGFTSVIRMAIGLVGGSKTGKEPGGDFTTKNDAK